MNLALLDFFLIRVIIVWFINTARLDVFQQVTAATSKLHSFQFDLQLGLLTDCVEIFVCSWGFLCVLSFPPTFQKHGSRWIGDAN